MLRFFVMVRAANVVPFAKLASMRGSGRAVTPSVLPDIYAPPVKYIPEAACALNEVDGVSPLNYIRNLDRHKFTIRQELITYTTWQHVKRINLPSWSIAIGMVFYD